MTEQCRGSREQHRRRGPSVGSGEAEPLGDHEERADREAEGDGVQDQPEDEHADLPAGDDAQDRDQERERRVERHRCGLSAVPVVDDPLEPEGVPALRVPEQPD
ncbi:hypothetical protein GCM10010196_30650 [Agromyces mediolanus]|uniref:Uncharacterized protein n=1 Tax=Agromyces mediolanus TaxID=41986 RepID=A0A918FDT5_AGRME|nr:hypothetical protein GCM10010196_30650 [Agromyces mediolanus]GLJ74116.1 hypothetical protein GCM10017583_33750 [Agromyces mediolanus]